MIINYSYKPQGVHQKSEQSSNYILEAECIKVGVDGVRYFECPKPLRMRQELLVQGVVGSLNESKDVYLGTDSDIKI